MSNTKQTIDFVGVSLVNGKTKTIKKDTMSKLIGGVKVSITVSM